MTFDSATYDEREILVAIKNAAASSGSYPDVVYVDPIMTPSANNGWTTITNDANCLYSGYKEVDSAAVTTNSITFDVSLAAGTWNVETMFVKSAAGGILTLTMDATSLGTVDTHSAALSRNNLATKQATIATAGTHSLIYTIPTKNASSSGYGGFLQRIKLLKTA